MTLIIFLLTSALAVSGCAAYFSVFGLAHTFPFAMYSLIILGSALEVSKLVVVSFVFRFWKKINFLFKSLSVFFVFFLMALTSIGIFGYLNAAYQSGAIDGKEISQKIEVLTEQKLQYEKQIAFIDNQIEKSPEKFISKKIELIKTLQKDRQNVSAKLDEVNTERNQLLNTKITSDAKLGPITFIAKAFGLPVDNAIGYLIGLIMLVFDPLALYLTVAFNIAVNDRENNKKKVDEVHVTSEPIEATLETVVDSNYEELRNKFDNLDDSHPRKQSIIANSRII